MSLDGIHPSLYDDVAAWQANPAHRWVYDRLLVADTTGLPSGPLGVPPAAMWPLVVKPITNLFGMGRGARVVVSGPIPYQPGYMWQEKLDGRHVSVDLRMDPHLGRAVWQATSIGTPGDRFGRFSRWDLLGPERLPETDTAEAWARAHLRHYAGPLNVELIGGRIIEVHLRLTADWLAAGVYSPFDSKPPPRAVLTPVWSDDETQGDHGRIDVDVTVLAEETAA